jgi:hypothetical protein
LRETLTSSDTRKRWYTVTVKMRETPAAGPMMRDSHAGRTANGGADVDASISAMALC